MSAHQDGNGDGDGADEVAEFAALLMALKEPTARSYGPLTRRLGMNTSTLLPNDRLRSGGSRRPASGWPPRPSTAARTNPHEGDREELAEQWMARHAEWRRVTALMDSQG